MVTYAENMFILLVNSKLVMLLLLLTPHTFPFRAIDIRISGGQKQIFYK